MITKTQLIKALETNKLTNDMILVLYLGFIHYKQHELWELNSVSLIKHEHNIATFRLNLDSNYSDYNIATAVLITYKDVRKAFMLGSPIEDEIGVMIDAGLAISEHGTKLELEEVVPEE